MFAINVASKLHHTPASLLSPPPTLFRRSTESKLDSNFLEAASDYAGVLPTYIEKFPSCAFLEDASLSDIPECNDAMSIEVKDTCGQQPSANATTTFVMDLDALACQCKGRSAQPTDGFDKCFDVACKDKKQDAEKAKETMRELVKDMAEKCWVTYNVGAGNGKVSTPKEDSAPVGSSGVRLGVKNVLLLGALVLPACAMWF